MLLCGSPPCNALSKIQTWNRSRMKPGTEEELKLTGRLLSLGVLNFTALKCATGSNSSTSSPVGVHRSWNRFSRTS